MSSTHKVAVAVVLLWSVGVFLFPGEVVHASHVECGEVITTDTVLDSDLTCPAEGIVIGADNITLDLNGHTLTGPGLTCSPICPGVDGVRVDVHTGVTIKNGYIAGFVFGVRLVDASNNVVGVAHPSTVAPTNARNAVCVCRVRSVPVGTNKYVV